MKLNYHADTDSLYIELSERPSVDSREISEGVIVDYDAEGRVVGIDLQEYNLSLAAGGRLRLHTGGLPMFPVQSWKRIASPHQK